MPSLLPCRASRGLVATALVALFVPPIATSDPLEALRDGSADAHRPGRDAASPGQPGDAERLAQLNAQAVRLARARRYQEALPIAEEALRLAMSSSAASKEDVFGAMANLGQIYRQLKRDSDAEQMYRSALALAQEASLAESAQAGIVHDNLSRLLLTTGRIEEADRESLEAVRVLRAAPGANDLHLAGALNNRALLLLERGLFDEAERHCLEALAMFRELLGDGNPQLEPFEADLEEIRRRKAGATENGAPPPDDR